MSEPTRTWPSGLPMTEQEAALYDRNIAREKRRAIGRRGMSEPTTEVGRKLAEDEMWTRLYMAQGEVADTSEDDFRAAILAIEAEARDEQAAQIEALREALTECVRALADHRHGVTGKCEGCAAITAVLALLASPAPAVEAYAARLRREGAEAALDVERIAAALHDVGIAHHGCFNGPECRWNAGKHWREWLQDAAALRAAILAAHPTDNSTTVRAQEDE